MTTLRAQELGTEYLIFVRPAPVSGPAGAILVLDADDQFQMMSDAVAALEASGRIPPLHVFGAGYGGSYRSPLNRRLRDYTPTRDPQEPAETGGGAKFLSFLSQELLPFVSRDLAIDRRRLVLAGHSLGSLFGLYALAEPSSPFAHYLVSSPSIWWHDRSVLEQVRAAARHPPGQRAAFFSVGDQDTESMRGDLKLLEEQLQAAPIPHLKATFTEIPGKDHYNAFPVAAAAGLEWLAPNLTV